MKNVRPRQATSLAAIALPAPWLLLAGPGRLLGMDAGKPGMVLLVTAAWASLLALALIDGWLQEYAATVTMHVRDGRR